MKKLLSLTAATFAALAWVGCSQDGVVNEAPSANQAIEFGTYLGRDAQAPTRATSTDIDYLKGENVGFGVFAYYTEKKDFTATNLQRPNFMDNQQVKWATNEWAYTPIKYWPNNGDVNNGYDKVSFFAYAPWKENTNSFITYGTTELLIKHTVTNDIAGDEGKTVDKSRDLLYAEALENKTKQALNEKVTFKFKHALARIGFTVQGAIGQTTAGGTIDDATTITVKKVMLSGAGHTYNGQGNVTLSETPAFYETAKLDLLTGSWSGYEPNKLLFTLEPKNFVNNTNVTLSGNQSTPTEGTELPEGQEEYPKKLNNDNSYLMIIPQGFDSTNADTTDDLYVYIEYTVTTTDASLNGGKSEITNYISTPVTIDFQAGNAYTLNLLLGLNSVDLDVNTDISWGTEQKPDVNLPVNQE